MGNTPESGRSTPDKSERGKQKRLRGVARVVKPSLSREDWLRAALEALNQRGIDAVKVLSLSKTLGVTRGSFYWHFVDREDLLLQVLDYWERELTDEAIIRAQAIAAEPEEKLTHLVSNIFYQSLDRYDTAIRAWSLFDDTAFKRMKKVERKRLLFIEKLLDETGMDSATVKFRARMLMGFVLAGPLGVARLTKAEKARSIKDCMEFILS